MGKERTQDLSHFFVNIMKRTSFEQLLQIYTKDLILQNFKLIIFKLFESIIQIILLCLLFFILIDTLMFDVSSNFWYIRKYFK